MPEWGTKPANHYLPRRKTKRTVLEEELVWADNPLKKESLQDQLGPNESSLGDVTSW